MTEREMLRALALLRIKLAQQQRELNKILQDFEKKKGAKNGKNCNTSRGYAGREKL